ncbi:hypothetical protein [Paractinoplanes abujensis]|uniref:Outer membrane murein-binding lipoprotein Lpp n=1 Tax=Paractinoplanes abujensis TaxID=882441 RepID=A0A7W7G4L9_9ACTN|nr:hypothetical protein [Actinoplanes abujensis]MBB4695769.1 outer membrane murein-binding lipoprotein Lpp [Actinoplanes abujensis]
MKMWTAVLGCLTALFALLAGVFVKKNDTATSKVDTTQAQVKVLASKNADLEADSARKDAKITKLEADLAAASSETSADESTSADPEPPAVFHKGPLTLKPAVYADLDATPEDPQWRVADIGRDDFDVIFDGDELRTDTVRASAMLIDPNGRRTPSPR